MKIYAYIQIAVLYPLPPARVLYTSLAGLRLVLYIGGVATVWCRSCRRVIRTLMYVYQSCAFFLQMKTKLDVFFWILNGMHQNEG